MTHKMQKTVRESNIELLRIICMFLIIAHHSVVHGGILGIDNCFNKYVALFLLPGGKMMFVTFIVISTWFLVDKEFRLERFIKTWLQVLFYSVIFAVVADFMGAGLNWHNWISVFFPIIGNSRGFAATYLAFYLLTPFLAILDKNMSQKQHLCLVVLVFYFEVISNLVKGLFEYNVVILSSELTLFVFIYFVTSYIKKYSVIKRKGKFVYFLVFSCIWGIIFCINSMIFSGYEGNEILNVIKYLCYNEESFLYILGGYSIFFYFSGVNIPNNVFINKIAKHVFGTLLFHDHNFFRMILWQNVFYASKFWKSDLFICWVFASIVIIYVVGVVVDCIREKLFTMVEDNWVSASL